MNEGMNVCIECTTRSSLAADSGVKCLLPFIKSSDSCLYTSRLGSEMSVLSRVHLFARLA